MRLIKTNKKHFEGSDKLAINALPPSGEIPRKSFGWLVWAISAVFVLFQFFLQLTSGEIVNGLMKSFQLTALGGGLLASAYYYIYVVLQAPAGLLMDRFGPRRLLTMGAAVVFLGSFCFALAHYVFFALVGRILMGAGAAFAFVGSLSIAAKWFPIERFAIMASILETTGMLGSLIGGSLLAGLVMSLGWRDCIFIATGFAGLLVILLWSVVRDAPENVVHITSAPRGHFWEDIGALIKHKTAWINGIYSGLIFSVVTVFVALWAVPFFQIQHHVSLLMSSLMSNIVFLGAAMGSPVMGWLDSYYPIRRYLFVGSALTAATGLFLILYINNLSIPVVLTLMWMVGFSVSSYVLSFVVANEISTPLTRSTYLGFTNMISVGSAPLFQPLIGLFLYLFSKHTGLMSAQGCSLHHYQLSLSLIPILVIIAAVLGFFIPKRNLPNN